MKKNFNFEGRERLAVSIRLPVEVVESLKRVAPQALCVRPLHSGYHVEPT